MEEVGKTFKSGSMITVVSDADCMPDGRYHKASLPFSMIVPAPKDGSDWVMPPHMTLTEEKPSGGPTGPEFTPAGTQVDAPQDVKVREALTNLDHSDDSHWTRAGKPSVQEVDRLCGNIGITRDSIDNAAPTFLRAEG